MLGSSVNYADNGSPFDPRHPSPLLGMRSSNSQATQSSNHPTRTQTGIWLALLALTLIASLANYGAYQFGTHTDDSQYVVLARSLIYSDKYGLMNVPGQPPAAKYPFGFPLLLVPTVLMASDGFDLLKLVSLTATILNAIILFWGSKKLTRGYSYWWGLAVCGLYLLSPLTIDLTRRVMSEPIFITCGLVALLLAEQRVQGSLDFKWLLAMSVALFFGLFSRTVGLVLVGTVFFYLLFRVGRKILKEEAIIASFLVIMSAIVVAVTPVTAMDLLPTSYTRDAISDGILDPVREAVGVDARLPEFSFEMNLDWRIRTYVGKEIRLAALPLGGGAQEEELAYKLGLPFLPTIIGFSVAALVGLGLMASLIRRGISAFVLYALIYFSAIFWWSWDDVRLLYPILPQIFLGVLMGLDLVVSATAGVISKQSPRNSAKVALAIIVVILLAISLFKSMRIDDSRLHAGDLQVRTTWLRANSAPSEILMTEAPETDYLYSARKTVPYPAPVSSIDRIEQYLKKNNVDYVVVAPEIRWQLDYKPDYSTATKALLPLLAELTSENQARLAYSSDINQVQIFQVIH